MPPLPKGYQDFHHLPNNLKLYNIFYFMVGGTDFAFIAATLNGPRASAGTRDGADAIVLKYLWKGDGMNKFTRTLLILATVAAALCGTLGANAFADEGYQIISTEDLERWLHSENKPFVVFAISQVEFEEAHIPDSVCIPMEEMGTLGRLPASLNTPIVFYCHGPG
jgi:hypothetical protein